MSGITGFIKELGVELIGELFSIGMLKKILTKGAASKAAEVGKEASGSAKAPDIKFGGFFNLSDETSYLGLIAQLQSDPAGKDAAAKVTSFLNNKMNDGQRRRFRVVVGTLAQAEYTKEVSKTKEEIPRDKGKPIVKESSKEIKTNLGLEFLKSFSAYTEDEMLAICEASGVMDTLFDQIGQGIASVGDVIDGIEKNPSAQRVMTSLADKMRARITTLNNRRTIGGTA